MVIPEHALVLDFSKFSIIYNIISANWDGFNDKESGLLGYTITVGKQHCEDLIHPHHDPHKHLFDKSQWTNSAMISPIPAPYTILPGKSDHTLPTSLSNEKKMGGGGF